MEQRRWFVLLLAAGPLACSGGRSADANARRSAERITGVTTDDADALTPAAKAALDGYYAHVNQGDFLGARPVLADDVLFTIPGMRCDSGSVDGCEVALDGSGDGVVLPFTGVWRGKDNVVLLFQTFMKTFTFTKQIVETVQITRPNELISFNDEAFQMNDADCDPKVKQAYEVGVIHHMTFDQDTGLVSSLTNYHDAYAAELAYVQQDAFDEPVLQAADGTRGVDTRAAADAVSAWLDASDDDARAALLDDNAVWQIPGPPPSRSDGLPFSGTWSGSDQVLTAANTWPMWSSTEVSATVRLVADHGKVAAVVQEVGTLADGSPYTLEKIDLFQLVPGGDGAPRIVSITSYFDSSPIVHALHPDLPIARPRCGKQKQPAGPGQADPGQGVGP